jgi:hypothetical protein
MGWFCSPIPASITGNGQIRWTCCGFWSIARQQNKHADPANAVQRFPAHGIAGVVGKFQRECFSQSR